MGREVTVWLGRKTLRFPIATHWAVRVGDYEWYEIDGAGKSEGEDNTINGGFPGTAYLNSRHSRLGAVATHAAGCTTKSDADIISFNQKFLAEHPKYKVITCNCQVYAVAFIQWLTNGACELPLIESGWIEWSNGPRAYVINDKQYAHARVTMGESSSQSLILGAKFEGPSAGASYFSGEGGHGAYLEASLINYETNLLPFFRMNFGINANTGAGIRDSTLDIRVLGFGVQIGSRGLGYSTPLGGAHFFG